jgi:hypothetical protein
MPTGLFFNATEPLRMCESAIASPAQCVMQSLSVPDAWRRFAAERPPRATFSKTNASIWLMNGTTPTAEVLVGSNPGPTWHIR